MKGLTNSVQLLMQDGVSVQDKITSLDSNKISGDNYVKSIVRVTQVPSSSDPTTLYVVVKS